MIFIGHARRVLARGRCGRLTGSADRHFYQAKSSRRSEAIPRRRRISAPTSFSTPARYSTNTMVYTASGYRFTDFPKLGLPLNLVFWAMAVMLIPRYLPL